MFTHGNANLFLDKKHFFVQENVDFMVSIIKEFGVKQMDFLACETLNYPDWARYYEQLRQETGIRIGASNNKTGNLPFASDWIMENTGEDVKLIYFTKEVELYKYLLDQEDQEDPEDPEHKIDENVIVK